MSFTRTLTAATDHKVRSYLDCFCCFLLTTIAVSVATANIIITVVI